MKAYQALSLEVFKDQEGNNNSLEELVNDIFPHGSGFDSSITLDAKNSQHLILTVPYHCMNDNGYYDGWIEVIYTITPSFDGFQMKENWKGYNGKYKELLKDYIGEVIYTCLEKEVSSEYDSENGVFNYIIEE